MKKFFLLSCLLVSTSGFGMRAFPDFFNKQIRDLGDNRDNLKSSMPKDINKFFGKNDFLKNVWFKAKNMQQFVEDIFKKENK